MVVRKAVRTKRPRRTTRAGRRTAGAAAPVGGPAFTLQICGRHLKVAPDSDCDKLGLWGAFDKYACEIMYRPGIKQRDLADTLLHESIHAISEYGLTGEDRLSERQVHALSNHLCQVLADNPDLARLVTAVR